MTTPHILVTGGAGFIGSHYVRTLLGPTGPPGIAVTVLDNLGITGNTANLDDVCHATGFAFVHGDICDQRLVGELASSHDQLVHFAVHPRRSPQDTEAFLRTNVLGTQVLLDAALRHGLRSFIHISTAEVYGSIRTGSWSEDDPLRANSPYAASKAASDILALAYHRTHGLGVRVIRCSSNYGHHQFPDRLVPLLITSLLNGTPLILRGDGLSIRDWIHIDDHVRGIELVRNGGRPGEIYNIGTGEEVSHRELAALLERECGADPGMIQFAGDRTGDDRRHSVDSGKIRTELGFAPRKSLATGLEETLDWYRAHRSWWEPLVRRASTEKYQEWVQ